MLDSSQNQHVSVVVIASHDPGVTTHRMHSPNISRQASIHVHFIHVDQERACGIVKEDQRMKLATV